MCKLLIMTGITEGLLALEFMKQMAIPMSKTNDHGIGYTGVSPTGELFSERWLNNPQFLDTKDVMTPEVAETLAAYTNRLPKGALDSNYSRSGEIDFTNVRTLTMHTRFATCGREFANTHPFIYDDVSLIHNGTIRNAFGSYYGKGLDVNKISTCDSEAALQTYIAQGVKNDTKKAKDWLDMLSGYWAFGILSRNAENNRILDVIRGTSFLYYMEIEGLGRIFTTDDLDAKAVAREMGLTFIQEPFLVETDTMYRYNAVTGQLLENVDIKPPKKVFGSQNSKTGGTTTTGTNSFRFPPKKISQVQETKKPGQALLDLVDMFRDDPDAMSLFPDIFTPDSTPKNLKIDHAKVKKHGNDTREPIIERLDIFDLVHSTSYVEKYESFPPTLREFIRDTDFREGLKSARGLINQLYEKKQTNVG